MKNFLILIAFTLVSQVLFAQQASIYFESKTHDYGTIKEEDGPVPAKFVFTNMGDDTLKITQVRASCGCTASKYTKEAVPPGGKGFVEATYNPRNRPGKFKKSLTVVSNDPDNKNVVLFIQGNVTPRPKTLEDKYSNANGYLRFISNHLAFQDILDSEIKTDSMAIYNGGNKKMTLEIKTLPEFISIEFKPNVLEAKQEGWIIISYDAAKRKDYGYIFDQFNIYTNDATNPTKPINVSANITQDFSHLSEKELKKAPQIVFDTTVFNFEPVKMGTTVKAEFKLANKGKSDLKILKMKAACGCTVAKLDNKTIKRKKEAIIQVEFNTTNRRGNQHKTLTIISNDPKNPVIVLHIQGKVQ
jgi:hypothetical protein